MLTLIAWLRWCLQGFLTVKLLFLFVVDEHLRGDTLRLCKHFVKLEERRDREEENGMRKEAFKGVMGMSEE